jgi:hypothetical protein
MAGHTDDLSARVGVILKKTQELVKVHAYVTLESFLKEATPDLPLDELRRIAEKYPAAGIQ